MMSAGLVRGWAGSLVARANAAGLVPGPLPARVMTSGRRARPAWGDQGDAGRRPVVGNRSGPFRGQRTAQPARSLQCRRLPGSAPPPGLVLGSVLARTYLGGARVRGVALACYGAPRRPDASEAGAGRATEISQTNSVLAGFHGNYSSDGIKPAMAWKNFHRKKISTLIRASRRRRPARAAGGACGVATGPVPGPVRRILGLSAKYSRWLDVVTR